MPDETDYTQQHVPRGYTDPSQEKIHEQTAEVESRSAMSSNDTFAQILEKEPSKPFTAVAIKLYAASLIGFLCATMDGYNGSLINNLLANKDFLDYYGGSNDGIWSGVVTSMYQIGGVAAFPFIGPAVDTWGRRVGMLIASLFTVFGGIIQGAGTNFQSFMGGSFLLGFGVSIAITAGPTYVAEVSHPAHRGVITAVYHTFWFTGAITAAGAARGALHLPSHASWRTIIWLQLLFAGLIAIFTLLLPESPRWLYVNNKRTQAQEMLTKFHGGGNPESEWVMFQLREYEEYLELDGADKRWWDYRALFRNKVSIYRLYCNCCISIFAQWMGNAVIAYFMSSVLDTAGYSGTVAQQNLILINNCQGFAWSILGATLVDKFGRRSLLLFSNIGCSLAWLGMTITTSEFSRSVTGAAAMTNNSSSDQAAGQASLAMIFIFTAIYALGITPLQALYPVEVLSFEMRAKGMAFSSLAVNAAGLLNKFAWPVSIARIGWRTYIIFTVWDAIQVLVIYFSIVETKGRTLEELDDIFTAQNPVKASIEKKRRSNPNGGVLSTTL